jgi:hypothetical protein
MVRPGSGALLTQNTRLANGPVVEADPHGVSIPGEKKIIYRDLELDDEGSSLLKEYARFLYFEAILRNLGNNRAFGTSEQLPQSPVS